jgi:hypothetical protein
MKFKGGRRKRERSARVVDGCGLLQPEQTPGAKLTRCAGRSLQQGDARPRSLRTSLCFNDGKGEDGHGESGAGKEAASSLIKVQLQEVEARAQVQ